MKRVRVKQLLIFNIIALIVVASSLWISLDMTAAYNELVTGIWIFITNSGSTIGVITLLLICILLLSIKVVRKEQRIKFGLVCVVLFGVVLGGSALLNEYLIKENLKVYRPNVELMRKNYDFNAEEFYQLESKPERKKYFNSFLKKNTIGYYKVNNNVVSPQLISLWAKETGFSFPSGHSVSAFLLASLLGYFILLLGSSRGKWIVIALFCWASIVALSRVMLGVHTPLDISLGALWGSVIGLFIILTGVIDRIAIDFYIKKGQIKNPSFTLNSAN